MDHIVTLYDKEQINNLLPIFAFKPKSVVILYDKNCVQIKYLEYIREVCITNFPNLFFEYKSYDGLNIDNILRTCINIIHKKGSCFFDITGAGEFGAIGAYEACKKTFTPIFKVDPLSEKLVNVYGCKILENMFIMPKFNIENIFALHGACVKGFNHFTPSYKDFDKILEFCNAIFLDIELWKKLCLFLQTGNSNMHNIDNKLFFYSPKIIKKNNSKIYINNFKFLKLAENLNFIHNLNIKKNEVSFIYRDKQIKSYLSNFGIWLELFCYVHLKKSKIFHDVRMSVKFDWNSKHHKQIETTNEIDITFFYGIHPYFISCKLSEPSANALRELSMYPSYFGGNNSKSALVIVDKINKFKSHTYTRAKDMNILVIDGNSIKNGKLIYEIKKSLNITQI